MRILPTSSVKIGLGALALFIDQMSGCEPVEAKGGSGLMRLVGCQQMGKCPAGRRRCLEAAVAPAGIEIEAIDWSAIDNRRSVHRHVRNAAPASKQARTADHRHQRHAALANVLDGGQIAAARIAVVAVDVTAKNQTALVGLADVEVSGAEGDDAGDQWLKAFGDEGLQRMAFDRQPKARQV